MASRHKISRRRCQPVPSTAALLRRLKLRPRSCHMLAIHRFCRIISHFGMHACLLVSACGYVEVPFIFCIFCRVSYDCHDRSPLRLRGIMRYRIVCCYCAACSFPAAELVPSGRHASHLQDYFIVSE